MRVMITGATGFIGGFLVKRCLQEGCSVLGIDIREPESEWEGAVFEPCDVRDPMRLGSLVSKFLPQRVFHLAAQSYPTVSLVKPIETMDVNVLGTVTLFESLRESGIMPMVVVAGSSAEYGPVAERDLPVRETHALAPLHPYGVSKVAQDLLAAQYFANYSIPTIRVRIFNTTGPGAIGDVCSDLTKRAMEVELERSSTVAVGNLASRRSLVDVRDLVAGLWLAAEHGSAGEVYNLGGDQTYSVEQIIEAIRLQLGTTFAIEQQAELLRRCDESIIVGDNSKLRGCCKWEPQIPLATTLRDMLDWWKKRLAASREDSVQSGETRELYS